jgi:hypothetical protein
MTSSHQHAIPTCHTGAAYTLALWAAVSALLTTSGDEGVDVLVPGSHAAGNPWQLRRGEGLPFHLERRLAGATLTELTFGNGMVDEAARQAHQFDLEHPLQPAPLFELPAPDLLAAVPPPIQRHALTMLLSECVGEDQAEELMFERTDAEICREIRRQGGWDVIEGYVHDAYSASVRSAR